MAPMRIRNKNAVIKFTALREKAFSRITDDILTSMSRADQNGLNSIKITKHPAMALRHIYKDFLETGFDVNLVDDSKETALYIRWVD